MRTDAQFDLDDTGKINIDDIYNAPDPRPYYSTLEKLEYQIPQSARSIFLKLIEDYRQQHHKKKIRILDIGCSYGINAALLKCDVHIDDLYERYASSAASTLGRHELLSRDRDLVDEHSGFNNIEVIGLDKSSNAIDYAIQAGFLDNGVSEDLEEKRPSTDATMILSDVDMIISTGCIGYVTVNTIKWLLKINAPHKPWLVNFVLRMFPFDEIGTDLETFGYKTQKIASKTFKQRRFASTDEQEQVVANLQELGLDTEGREADGWFHAEAFVSRPA